jgi:hypothetical protein
MCIKTTTDKIQKEQRKLKLLMTQERDPLPHPQLDDAAENHKHTAAWAATTRAQNWRNTTKFPSETTAAKPNLERSK